MLRAADRNEVSRVWVAGPRRWRREVDLADGSVAVMVVNGARWWSYAPHVQAVSNAGAPDRDPLPEGDLPVPELLDPRSIIATLLVTDRHPSEMLKRPVETLRGVPESDSHPRAAPGADEYELILDPRLDIALRLSASLEGRPVLTIEVTKLELTGPMDPSILEIALPPGASFSAPATS
jgi:outer membrane lipoprotein-sorting protein